MTVAAAPVQFRLGIYADEKNALSYLLSVGSNPTIGATSQT